MSSKKKKKAKKIQQNYPVSQSLFSKRFPLWLAPIFGAIASLLFFGGASLLFVEQIPWEVFCIIASLGALAGGILWMKKR
ncbi:MAG: hypothetical protein HUU50_03565 [Candidatus Brocadiae bacterium]|nr:hypothetical protein [Candidatus Brocadiia bacterium]